jgi:hypothetical protein
MEFRKFSPNSTAVGTFTGPAGTFRQRTEIGDTQARHRPAPEDLPAHPAAARARARITPPARTEPFAMITADPRFEQDLAALLEENDITPGLLDVLNRLASRPAYYKMPAYSRYSQLAFIAALGFSEVNRQLIRASVAFLEREFARRLAVGDGRVRDYLLCMAHISGWDLDPGEERDSTGQRRQPGLHYAVHLRR